MNYSTVSIILSTQSYDSERNNALKGLINSVSLVSSDLPKLGSLYKNDSHRNEGFKIATNAVKIFNQMIL